MIRPPIRPPIRHRILQPVRQSLAALLLALAGAASIAAYAHGPDGGDGHDHGHAAADSGEPGHEHAVIEAHTEMFELVGTLAADELSVMVDRYATNEPVTAGTLEVEFNGIKAQGRLHADAGDFAFTDEALLRALRQPGVHPLVFTLIAGPDSDLIEGTLQVAAGEHQHERAWARSLWLWAGVLVAAAAVAVSAWRLRRRHPLPRGQS